MINCVVCGAPLAGGIALCDTHGLLFEKANRTDPDMATTAGLLVWASRERTKYLRAAIAKPLRALLIGIRDPRSLDDDQCARCGCSVTVDSELEWERGDLCHPCAGTFARNAIETTREVIRAVSRATRASTRGGR